MSIEQRLFKLTSELTKPTIHMNGTSREALLEDFVKVIDALNVAMEALQKSGPNGRDYYPQGDGALRKAQNEHLARMKKLKEVQDEIQEIAESIA